MGMKRKASDMEEVSFHHPSSPPSLTSVSTSSSPSSMCTEPYHLPLLDGHWTNNNESAPWLNLRTRKRVRNNRPSEEQIHSTTIQKLFDAQKRDVEDTQMSMVTVEEEDFHMELDTDIDMLDNEGSSMQVVLPPEPNQRSLHDFFANNGPTAHPPKQRSLYDFFSHSMWQQPLQRESNDAIKLMSFTTTPSMVQPSRGSSADGRPRGYYPQISIGYNSSEIDVVFYGDCLDTNRSNVAIGSCWDLAATEKKGRCAKIHLRVS